MAEEKKLGFWGYFKPLVCDNDSGLSLGRISFWIVLYKALSIWEVIVSTKGEVSIVDIPPYLFYLLGALLAYGCYKKLTDPKSIILIKAWKGTDKENV
jgi:hypothetical protein